MSNIDKQRIAAVRKLVGAIVVSVIVTTSAHAVETTLHCTVEGPDGDSKRQQHVTISIEQDIWGLQEEGKAEVKGVRGVTHRHGVRACPCPASGRRGPASHSGYVY